MNSNTKYIHVVVFFAVTVVILLNLGAGEVQPWDEGLYAVRAASIEKSHNFIDQTSGSLGGLYSSTAPPLTIWAIYSTMQILGENPWGIRLFAAMCSILSAILIYFISLKFVHWRYAILTPLLLTSANLWNEYSRQAMTDAPLNFFFLLIFYLIIKYYEADRIRNIILITFAIALTLAMALLTKITISLLPLLFLLIYYFTKQKISKKILLTCAMLAGIALAVPWYWYMSQVHGAEFYNALFLPHIADAVENNTRSSGVFYYVNNLITSLPILILLFIVPTFHFKVGYWRMPKSRKKFISISAMTWFISVFLLLAGSTTKMPHYTLYLFAPAILLLTYYLNYLRNRELTNFFSYVLLVGLFSAFYWAFSYDFRQEAKAMAHLQFSPSIIIYILLIIVSFAYYKFSNKICINKFARLMLNEGMLLLVLMLFVKTFFVNWLLPTGNSFGASTIVKDIRNIGADSVIYLNHTYYEGDTINPQLCWYLDKIEYKFKYNRMSIAKDTANLKKLMSLELHPQEYILYYLPAELATAELVFSELYKTRDLLYSRYNYFLFSKKVRERDKGMPI